MKKDWLIAIAVNQACTPPLGSVSLTFEKGCMADGEILQHSCSGAFGQYYCKQKWFSCRQNHPGQFLSSHSADRGISSDRLDLWDEKQIPCMRSG